ncbi:MAG: SelB C-terminal domain-containing protein [Proteobacteria bacterium]|nr:SelB C-terminal domain-containing protein [Pseudomonadota bacterium]
MSTERSDRPNPLEGAIVHVLRKSRRHPVPFKKLYVEVAREIDSQKTATIGAALEALAKTGVVLVFDDVREPEYFLVENLDTLKTRLCTVVRAYHVKYPYEAGMKVSEIKKGFSETQTMSAKRNVDARVFDLVFSACAREGLVVSGEAGVRMPDFKPQSRDDEEIMKLEAAVATCVAERPFQKVSVEHLSRFLGVEMRKTKAVITGMLRARRLIEVEDGRFVEPQELERVQRAVQNMLRGGARLRLTEIAERLGQSRTSIRPVLDYLDRIGFTRRDGDLRGLVSAGVDHQGHGELMRTL